MATTITITIDGDQQTISTCGVPSSELLSVLQALKNGDFTARADGSGNLDAEYNGIVNQIMVQHQQFAAEVTRLTHELGTRGVLGGQIELTSASGEWRNLVEHINAMSANLTAQLRTFSLVMNAIADGDYSRKITVRANGETAEICDAINRLTERLASTPQGATPQGATAQPATAEAVSRNAASSSNDMPKLSGANEMETTIEVFDETEPGND